MLAEEKGAYLTNRTWFSNVLQGEDVILCYTSALEHLGLFSGYINNEKIDVYAKKRGKYDNVNYRIVNTFNGIESVKIKGLMCTSINQTINDMLYNFNNIDEQALVEALSYYYFSNKESFSNLIIKPENLKKFNEIKGWAIEYYSEG